MNQQSSAKTSRRLVVQKNAHERLRAPVCSSCVSKYRGLRGGDVGGRLQPQRCVSHGSGSPKSRDQLSQEASLRGPCSWLKDSCSLLMGILVGLDYSPPVTRLHLQKRSHSETPQVKTSTQGELWGRRRFHLLQ